MKKKKLKNRTKFTILSITMLILYTIAVLILTGFDKVVPSELTVAWFSAWTAELGMLFGIKIKDRGDSV